MGGRECEGSGDCEEGVEGREDGKSAEGEGGVEGLRRRGRFRLEPLVRPCSSLAPTHAGILERRVIILKMLKIMQIEVRGR